MTRPVQPQESVSGAPSGVIDAGHQLLYCAALRGAIGALLLGLGLRHRPGGTSR